MDEWEAMALPRTAASYYMQRGAVSVSGTQMDSPMSAHGVNASAEILKGKPNASAELSEEEEPDASVGVAQEEPVRRKPGRPRKLGLSQGEPVASEPNASARLSGEPVRKKLGRPRKLELSQEEPDASAGGSQEEPKSQPGLSQGEPVSRKRGRPRKRKLSLGESDEEEPKFPPGLSQGESVKRKRGRPRKCELSLGEFDASAGVLQEESPPGLSQGESVKRKRGRPRKCELSQGESDEEEPKSPPGLSQGESVSRKRGRPRKRELSQGESDEEEPKSPPGLSQGESVKRKRGRPRKRELSPEEPDASAGDSQEEPNALGILSQGEPVRRKPGRPRKRGPDGMVSLGLPNQNLPVQSNLGGNSAGSAFQSDSSSPLSAHGVNDSVEGESVRRRKVGRPRKYGPDGKRRSGRPRKYGIDWTVSSAGNSVGSAFQLDSSSPILAHGVNASASEPVRRRPGRPRKKGLSSIAPPPPSHGEWISGSAEMGLTPDIISIAVGEDIAKKVMSFLQQGPRVVCILSANGAVSSVTLRQPSTSSDTVKYEGHYEILWLSGSYMLTGNDGSCSRTGGLSVSLCSHDGQVICGAVDEMLVAATPVQVIVGSFMCSKTKHAVVVTISESSVDGDKSVTPTDHPSQSGDKSVTPTEHPSGDKSVTPTDHPSQSGDKSATPTEHPSGDQSVSPTSIPPSNQNLRE